MLSKLHIRKNPNFSFMIWKVYTNTRKNYQRSRINEHLTISSDWAGLIKHGETHTFTWTTVVAYDGWLSYVRMSRFVRFLENLCQNVTFFLFRFEMSQSNWVPFWISPFIEFRVFKKRTVDRPLELLIWWLPAKSLLIKYCPIWKSNCFVTVVGFI